MGVPIGPEYAAVLAQVPAFDLTDVPALRAKLTAARPHAEMSLDPRVDIQHILVPASAGGTSVPIRLYAPLDRPTPAAAILFCHGGGFVLGSLETEHERCLRFAAEAGVVVVSPDYRLAPEHPYPAAHQDCYTVLRWLSAHAEAHGVDPERLAVGGASAGAALAFGLALRARDERGPELARMVLVCPVTDNRLLDGSIREFWDCVGWNGAATAMMWDHYLPEPDRLSAGYAVPARAQDLTGLPPTLIALADHDPLHDEGSALAARMRHAGVPIELHEYTAVPHGFDTFCPTAPQSARSLNEQVRALVELTKRS